VPDRSNGYERVAAAFLTGRGGTRGAPIGAAAVSRWARSLPAGASVLDLGCGSGLPVSRILLEAGLRVHGIDASPTLVAAFRARFPDSPVVCEAVEDSTFFHRTFDAIVAWGLWFLLPAEAQRDLIRRVAPVLVPGGRLLFTAPARPQTWHDAMTGERSESLGAGVYREHLAAAGFVLLEEFEDEGENHYYDAVKARANT